MLGTMLVLLAGAGAGAIAAEGESATSEESAGRTAPVEPSERIARQLAEAGESSLTEQYPPPNVTATGWLVYDARSNEPVAGEAASTARPIASLAKLMTALVVVDRTKPDELVTIPQAVNELGADASRMDARPGEKWPVSDLLLAMLAHSANDAALALALHVGEGEEAAFVELMNERAEELGLSDTTFASSTGLDASGAASTSTPIDLVALADAALAEDAIREAVATRQVTLTRPGGGDLDPLPNRNPLLGRYEGVDGVKTGFTDDAGYMLVVHHVDEATNGELLVATFASTSEQTRASDATALLDWARPLRQELRVVEGGASLGTIPVQRSDERLEIFACDDLLTTARVGQRLVREVVVPRSIAPPVREGDEVGQLRVYGEDEDPDAPDAVVHDGVPICAGTTLRERSRVGRVRDYAGDYRDAWRMGIDEVEDAWSSLTEQVA